MIYPANFEQKVGFDRLREQVAALCTIRGGRERLCAEQFSTSQADVERRLALADEMRRLLEMERDFPDDEFVDVDYILSKLKIEGSFLEVEEVVLLRRALASAGRSPVLSWGAVRSYIPNCGSAAGGSRLSRRSFGRSTVSSISTARSGTTLRRSCSRSGG